MWCVTWIKTERADRGLWCKENGSIPIEYEKSKSIKCDNNKQKRTHSFSLHDVMIAQWARGALSKVWYEEGPPTFPSPLILLCGKYANSVSQFLSYWMRIIFCIYKDFVQQLKAFLPSFCRDRAGGGARGGFSPPTFLAVDVRTWNVQLEIFKVLMKDGEFTCFDDILSQDQAAFWSRKVHDNWNHNPM